MFWPAETLKMNVLKKFKMGTLLQTISFLSGRVLSQGSAKEFCKDVQQFAGFGTFGRKWSCLFMKTLKIWYIFRHWLTLTRLLLGFTCCQPRIKYFRKERVQFIQTAKNYFLSRSNEAEHNVILLITKKCTVYITNCC